MKTKYKTTASVDKILDIAFVFSVEDINDDVSTAYGISNLYLLRFQADERTYKPVQGHHKFACKSPNRYLNRSLTSVVIWYGICRIQDVL